MDAYDGLLTFYPTATHLLNESFQTDNELDNMPTTNKIIWNTLIGSNDGSGILPYRSILNLYGNGCLINETQANCTKACAKRQYLFQDWQTKWNCLTLANMAVNKPYPHKFHNVNNIGDTSEALNLLAVTNLTAFDASGVLQRFVDCAKSSDYGTDNYFDGLYLDGRPNIHNWGIKLYPVCSGPMVELDSDLAGPGVLFSYIMSIAIVLYNLSCIRVLRISSTIGWFVKLTRYRDKVNSFITFHRSRLATRIGDSTGTFIAEMQEAQSFFMLAVQIGVLYSYSRKPGDFMSSQKPWQDLLYNRFFMKRLAVIAALPIVLNQVTLHKVRLDSVYSLSLCTIVFIVTYVTFHIPLTLGLDFKLKSFEYGYQGSKRDLYQPECYTNPLLSIFCFTVSKENLQQPKFLTDMCFAAISLLWFKKLWRDLGGARWLKRYAETVSKKKILILLYIIQLANLSITVFLFILEIIFIAFMAMNLPFLYRLLGTFVLQEDIPQDSTLPDGFQGGATQVSPANWSIGQIVSVLVWAPVIAKYLYLLIFGVEKSFAIRVSGPFAIIKKPTQRGVQGNDTDDDDDST